MTDLERLKADMTLPLNLNAATVGTVAYWRSLAPAYGARTWRGGMEAFARQHGSDFRWVDPLIFPRGSIDRHDADHYGIRVPLNNITEG